jgi:hypothetical protein
MLNLSAVAIYLWPYLSAKTMSCMNGAALSSSSLYAHMLSSLKMVEEEDQCVRGRLAGPVLNMIRRKSNITYDCVHRHRHQQIYYAAQRQAH